MVTSADVMKLLLDRGSELNSADHNITMPMCAAAIQNDKIVALKLLLVLDRNADVNVARRVTGCTVYAITC